MPDAVVLFFDAGSEGRIRGAWRALAAAGVSRSMEDPSFRPHLTLSVADGFRGLEPEIASLAASSSPFPLGLDGIGLFPDTGTAYATVGPRSALFDLHRRVDALCAPRARSLHAWYRPDDWTPHVTLAFGLDAELLAPAVEVLARLDLKSTADVTALALIRGGLDGWSEVLEFPFGREDLGE